MAKVQKGELDVFSVGLALGIAFALFLFFIGLLAAWLNLGVFVVMVVGSLYLGYTPTLLGTLIGTVWGFVDGFIGGVIFAWLYNQFQKSQK